MNPTDALFDALIAEIEALKAQLKEANDRINALRDAHKTLVEVMMNFISER